MILGTAAYMSPEQARGKAADKRTDMWAFGCVLYEMLSGRIAFQRATTSETIAAVLECEPDFATLSPGTPASIRGLLRRCLQKDPRQRLRDMGDARLEITEALARPHADVAVDAARLPNPVEVAWWRTRSLPVSSPAHSAGWSRAPHRHRRHPSFASS